MYVFLTRGKKIGLHDIHNEGIHPVSRNYSCDLGDDSGKKRCPKLPIISFKNMVKDTKTYIIPQPSN